MKRLPDEEIEQIILEYQKESRDIWDSDLPRNEKIDKAFQLVDVPQRVAHLAEDGIIRQMIEKLDRCQEESGMSLGVGLIIDDLKAELEVGE